MDRLGPCAGVLLGTVALWLGVAAAQPQRPAVWLGGDVHLGLAPAAVMEPLRPLLDGQGVVNLEGSVAEHPPRREGLRLFNHPRALPLLKALGVVAVGLDNNHQGDAGRGALEATLGHVNSAGLLPLWRGKHVGRFMAGGSRVVVTQHDLSNGLPKDLARELTVLPDEDGITVALFHVTNPESYLPSHVLKQAVDMAVAAGVHVVAAHGSHMVGPVVWRGSTLVAFGLGNVVMACDCTREKDAVVLRVEVGKGGVERAQVIPIQAGLNRTPAQPHPEPHAVLELLSALGSAPMERLKDRGVLTRP